MQVSKHPPVTFPTYDRRYLAMSLNRFENIGKSARKDGAKLIGSHTDHPMHVVHVFYETPSMDALMGMMMEPDIVAMIAFCKTRVFPVMDHRSTHGMHKN
ncbi:MAG: type I 3-dehydroquinate dehydratase [Euryarchaeota archaeon]|nr:type I 3-dehydroquinate dehydratase [Euryarchaeota archaeon]